MPDESKKPRKKRKDTFKFVPSMVDDVKVMAGRGMTQEHIANYFGIGASFFYELKKRYPELQTAYIEGKAKMIALASGKLIELVKKGNPTAVIFYLKTQARFRETDRPDDQDESGAKDRPAITITVNDPVEAARIYQKFMMET